MRHGRARREHLPQHLQGNDDSRLLETNGGYLFSPCYATPLMPELQIHPSTALLEPGSSVLCGPSECLLPRLATVVRVHLVSCTYVYNKCWYALYERTALLIPRARHSPAKCNRSTVRSIRFKLAQSKWRCRQEASIFAGSPPKRWRFISALSGQRRARPVYSKYAVGGRMTLGSASGWLGRWHPWSSGLPRLDLHRPAKRGLPLSSSRNLVVVIFRLDARDFQVGVDLHGPLHYRSSVI